MAGCRNSKDFPQCQSCINREFDPFQCIDCDNASNFEPIDEGEEEDIDYDDFLSAYRELEAA